MRLHAGYSVHGCHLTFFVSGDKSGNHQYNKPYFSHIQTAEFPRHCHVDDIDIKGIPGTSAFFLNYGAPLTVAFFLCYINVLNSH